VSNSVPIDLHSLAYYTDRTSKVEYEDFFGNQTDMAACRSLDFDNLCANLCTFTKGTILQYIPKDCYNVGSSAFVLCTCPGTGSTNFGITGQIAAGSQILSLHSYVGLVPGKIFWDVISSVTGKVYIHAVKHVNYNSNGNLNIVFPHNFINTDSSVFLVAATSKCTGNIGSRTFTVDNVWNLAIGQYVDILNAVSAAEITSIKGNVVTIDQTLLTSCNGVPVTWHAPTFSPAGEISPVTPVLRIAGSQTSGGHWTLSGTVPSNRAPLNTDGEAILHATVQPSYNDSDHYITVSIPYRGIQTNFSQAVADIGIVIWEQTTHTLVNFGTARINVSETTGINAISDPITNM